MTRKARETTLHVGQSQGPPLANGTSVMTPQVVRQMPDTPYWETRVTAAYSPPCGAVPCGTYVAPPKTKSILEAYLLGLPFGMLGAHHFYLGRPVFGVLYFFSLGLLGFGWFIDLLRMPCLVSSVNKLNKEKYEQLSLLQQQLQQAQQQGQLPAQHVVFVAFEPKSLADAYIMWFPCGLLGFHHFYLRNYGMGFLYLLTLGLLGIGWLVDLFRMPSLVKEANTCFSIKGAKQYSHCTAHILSLSPAGILGGHHYYLDRPVWGLLYTLTLGLLGIGWICDWFRTFKLVERANSIRQGMTLPNQKFLDDAYILCIPFGFTGLHHFYLRRYGWGCLYFFTLGILGLGWLVDWFRLPCLVRECNDSEQESRQLLAAGQSSQSLSNVIITGTGNSTLRAVGSTGGQMTISPGQPPLGVPTSYVYPLATSGLYYQGYQGQQASAPFAGPYPSYMMPGAGVIMYPPQYLPNPTGVNGPAAHGAEVLAPPSYEASLETKTVVP